MYYKLNGKIPEPCKNMFDANVGLSIETTNMKILDYKVLVSTVFLGIDHSHSMGGPPVLFETMVFANDVDKYQCRYTNYDDAIAGHKEIILKVRGLDPDYDNIELS